jgi:GntR family transcriptional regulator
MTVEPHIPRYRRIEQALRTRIASMRPGDALPSDAELCTEFGVSRMTARNAMKLLADEGLVHRLPGRGSFVAAPPAHRRADRLLTFSREMERRGRVPSSDLLERDIRTATDQEAAALHLDMRARVVVVRRLRRADGEPIALETAVLDGRLGPVVLTADLVRGSLHEALAAAGYVLRRGSATIGAEAATADDAALLGIRQGSPMLVERRVISDTHGRRLEATESRYPGDRYALDVQFEVEAAPGRSATGAASPGTGVTGTSRR